MKYNFFTIPAKHSEASQDALNVFCSQHRVAFVEKQFIADGDNSFWSICVSWEEGEVASSIAANQRKSRVDYKLILSEENFGFYLDLHSFRRKLSQEQGIPVYAMFSNDQIAEMVQQRTHTKAGLAKLSGVGASRIEKYGDDFLLKLNELWADKV